MKATTSKRKNSKKQFTWQDLMRRQGTDPARANNRIPMSLGDFLRLRALVTEIIGVADSSEYNPYAMRLAADIRSYGFAVETARQRDASGNCSAAACPLLKLTIDDFNLGVGGMRKNAGGAPATRSSQPANLHFSRKENR